jgi:hypothetical protein
MELSSLVFVLLPDSGMFAPANRSFRAETAFIPG